MVVIVDLFLRRANDVRPDGLFGRVCCAAKSRRYLRIYVVLRDRKAVQVYASMLVLFDAWVLCAFWICSAPLSRLTPIEALPQTPTGLCPVPTRGFTPWPWPGACPWSFCSLRSVLNFTSCLVFTLVSYAHSSFLTPHSSLVVQRFEWHKTPPVI